MVHNNDICSQSTVRLDRFLSVQSSETVETRLWIRMRKERFEGNATSKGALNLRDGCAHTRLPDLHINLYYHLRLRIRTLPARGGMEQRQQLVPLPASEASGRLVLIPSRPSTSMRVYACAHHLKHPHPRIHHHTPTSTSHHHKPTLYHRPHPHIHYYTYIITSPPAPTHASPHITSPHPYHHTHAI